MDERKSERLESITLLDYTALNDRGETVNQAMGRTLNVSEKGILLDSHIPFRVGQELALSVEFENDIVEFKGKVVHTEKNEQGRYSSGIEFLSMDPASEKILKRYLEAFHTPDIIQ